MARTGKHPNEINQGVIAAIQRPGKPKGSIENIRPIYTIHVKKNFSDLIEETYNTQIRCRNSSKPSCVQARKKYDRTCFYYKDVTRKSNHFTVLHYALPRA